VRVAAIDQYVMPAGCSAANLPHVAAADVTDGRTDARSFHRPCSAYYADSVKNVMHSLEQIVNILSIYCSTASHYRRFQRIETVTLAAPIAESVKQWAGVCPFVCLPSLFLM